MRAPSVLAATLLAAGMLAVSALPAAAAGFLDPSDATELSETLAEAKDAQGICYGWRVTVTGTETVDDAGSSAGATTPVDQATGCTVGHVELVVSVEYTSEFSEREDSASFDVVSDIPGAPTASDLGDLGFGDGDFRGDDGDVSVYDATSSLVLLSAEKGLAPFLELEPNIEALPAGDAPTGSPVLGDALRENLALVIISGLAVAGGLGGAIASALGRP